MCSLQVVSRLNLVSMVIKRFSTLQLSLDLFHFLKSFLFPIPNAAWVSCETAACVRQVKMCDTTLLASAVCFRQNYVMARNVSPSAVEERCLRFHWCRAHAYVFPLAQECREERCGRPPLPPVDTRGSDAERDVDSAPIKSDSVALCKGCLSFAILAAR